MTQPISEPENEPKKSVPAQVQTETAHLTIRPDPAFKVVTEEEAVRHGLISEPTELPQLLHSDLNLIVPANLSLEDTMFNFLLEFNGFEFKSENDDFGADEFIESQTRAWLYLKKIKRDHPEVQYSQVQNVIVKATYPREFFKQAKAEGCRFQNSKERPWLYLSQTSFQRVAVVVCNQLPLEPRYFRWLLFAPVDSPQWRNCVIELARRHELHLLRVAWSIRPKEFKELMRTNTEISRVYAAMRSGLTPAEHKVWLEQQVELAVDTIKDLKQSDPTKLQEVVREISPEERVAGLKPEERLSGLSVEEIQALLKKYTSDKP